ncbi:hypothetical protein PPL_09468 [Heterostelium album PN500]|uniref:Uncharacterized protein n=1 Tax=Heterostelium pallidum (strain ATCC 26659 / Pp 5 / PN500) TaxID=670386 RepID=D3BPJ9_HETP5|nr:hypothetical protein PPL_09468 [Heterostelium album PN500]EFA76717.1 hypothetical protein PPL_09468 [Heterostelium album PN500]|eukprot:XP_020428849.1 hypothetical protein PPL_09468 [Heterostelium album PN500]
MSQNKLIINPTIPLEIRNLDEDTFVDMTVQSNSKSKKKGWFEYNDYSTINLLAIGYYKDTNNILLGIPDNEEYLTVASIPTPSSVNVDKYLNGNSESSSAPATNAKIVDYSNVKANLTRFNQPLPVVELQIVSLILSEKQSSGYTVGVSRVKSFGEVQDISSATQPYQLEDIYDTQRIYESKLYLKMVTTNNIIRTNNVDKEIFHRLGYKITSDQRCLDPIIMINYVDCSKQWYCKDRCNVVAYNYSLLSILTMYEDSVKGESLQLGNHFITEKDIFDKKHSIVSIVCLDKDNKFSVESFRKGFVDSLSKIQNTNIIHIFKSNENISYDN